MKSKTNCDEAKKIALSSQKARGKENHKLGHKFCFQTWLIECTSRLCPILKDGRVRTEQNTIKIEQAV